MIDLFRRAKFFGLRRRYLFNIYLMVGSLAIVVVTTVFTIRVSKSVERQSFLTTQLLSGVVSRLFTTTAENFEEVESIIEIVNENEVPFILTDNAGRPIMWNMPVIGIPVPDYQILLQESMSNPSNPVILEILSLAAAYDQEQEPFAIVDDNGARLGTLHYGRSALSQRLRILPYLELMVMTLFFLIILWALQNKKEAQQKALFAGTTAAWGRTFEAARRWATGWAHQRHRLADRSGQRGLAADTGSPHELGTIGLLFRPGVANQQEHAHQGDNDERGDQHLVHDHRPQRGIVKPVAGPSECFEGGVSLRQGGVLLQFGGSVIEADDAGYRHGDQADDRDDPDRCAHAVTTRHEPKQVRKPGEWPRLRLCVLEPVHPCRLVQKSRHRFSPSRRRPSRRRTGAGTVPRA